MIKLIVRLIMIFTQTLSHAVFATEEYELTVSMPISQAGAKVELRQLSFTTYYSRLETRVGVVTWDPCKAIGQTSDCDLLNPLNAINLKVNVHAYNAENINYIDGCYIEFDFTQYKPLSNELKRAIDTDYPLAQLLRLAVQSIERNTRDSPNAAYYMDCEFRLLGSEPSNELGGFKLPVYLNPVISTCETSSPAGRKQAIALNNKGMEYYRRKHWMQAAKSFRLAAEQDCTHFISRTNLASVLALQGKFHQAQTVLWRAYKLDARRTMKKLETDSDYRKLKNHVNFYSASSPVGMSYRRYCYAPAKFADINSGLLQLIKTSKAFKKYRQYSVAQRYAFKADFNKNGIDDWVYPLVNTRLETLMVIFDGNKLGVNNCTSIPFQNSDFINANRGDPCKTKIFMPLESNKSGISLEANTFVVNRAVCN